MGITVNDLVVYHYEKQPSDFKVGELLHNFNGNDYRVMENYGRGDALLMQMNTGMFVVAKGIATYKRYPKDESPTTETLLMFMILQPVSGILMSKHLYTFLPAFSLSAFARNLHMILSYWGYVLLCIHAGTHLSPMISKLKKKKIRSTAFCALTTAISAYGVYAFIKRGFPGYMSGRMMFAFFDYSEPRIFFFLDYFTIMILFMMFGCLTAYGLGRIDIKRKVEEK